MKNIIFIAPPAAGKGTQSNMLKEMYGYIHLSTGDMLREVIASGSDFGLVVKNIINNGNLVSDEIMIDLIKNKLTEIKGESFILDGFPRTLNQAKILDNIINNDYEAIYLDLTKEDAIKRIEGRLTCGCGKSYNVNDDNLKPKVEGICDQCGSKLVKRNDDNVEAFKVRFESFETNTKLVLEYYESKGKLHKINVNRNVLDIYNDILKVVAND